ncbi:MAG TPA: DNA methyltransferase [Longimicrobiales bacterium]
MSHTTASSIESALARASARSRLAPLVRALGLEPRNAPVPPAARGAFGLAGAERVRGLAVIGERGGLVALVIELAGELTAEAVATTAQRVRAHNPARPYLFLFAAARYRRLAFASFGLDGELRHLVIERARPRASELEALEEMVAAEGEGGVALALRHAHALDRTRVTRQFFRDFRAQRAAVAEAWTGIPADAKPERDQLALLLLSRLMFLYFLQRAGHLAGDPTYLPGLLRRWRRGGLAGGAGEERAGATATFFRAVLCPLFFGALNTRPERRDAAARALGELPYLNGGLFERHALERRFPDLDLPDHAAAAVFDELLERYRFTARDAAEAAAEPGIPAEGGVDPEMLGRVFEELMAAERRGATGTYYTPAPVVARLVREALAAYVAGRPGVDSRVVELMVRQRDPDRGQGGGSDGSGGQEAGSAHMCVARPAAPAGAGPGSDMAGRPVPVPAPGGGRPVLTPIPGRGQGLAALARDLAQIRVLDPACGSGAFLLGALSQLARLREALGAVPPGGRAELRREIIGRSLHGVDLQEDAALLCALRLWLALAVGAEHEARGAAGGSASNGGASSNDGPPVTYATIPPLPNLDRRIRQGDALVDPLDLIAAPEADAGRAAGLPVVARDPTVRQAIRGIGPLAARYLTAGPEEKPELQRRLAAAEAAVARAWLDALGRRLDAVARELRADAASRDLFGERPPEARVAEAALKQAGMRQAELGRLRASLEDAGALPFFSFGVHFAEAAERGFDLVLSNPPWVRAHRWPAALKSLVRRRYAVCRSPGWRRGAELAGAPAAAGAQVDLSLLFLERSIRLLAPGGALAMLLPAKMLRSMYGAGGRRLLLAETELVALEDHSLDQRAIFRADAFAAVVVARKAPPGAGRLPLPGPGVAPAGVGVAGSPGRQSAAVLQGGAAVHPAGAGHPPGPDHDPGLAGAGRRASAGPRCRVTLTRRGVPPLCFEVCAGNLPLVLGDADSPWLLAPPDAARALRRMQAAGPPLGAHPALRVHRGVVTGANAVLLVREARPRLGDLASIRAEGYAAARRDGLPRSAARRYEAVVEAAAVRPLVRGSGIAAWRYRTAGWVVWSHDDATGAARPAPPRAARYLARHLDTLRARDGWHEGMPPGALFRLTAETLRPKVAWHDLAETVKAVALPARVRSLGQDAPLIPLNTVYFIAARGDDEALLLAALLNSLPVRTFARAIAERAKDARFRFLAWTMALLPLPPAWVSGRAAGALLRISRDAHRAGAITADRQRELDLAVAGLYGLGPADLDALAAFDRWLRGEAAASTAGGRRDSGQ